jgi:tetratricopeptide (TPR) repeat protein
LLKQWPAALKLYDRALDLRPNDPDVIVLKAAIYQAEGNLQEAAKLLSGINETSNNEAFGIKILQLQYERNYNEANRLLQARLVRSASEYDKADARVNLAYNQRLAGDTAGARVAAEKARSTLEQRYKDEPDDPNSANSLSFAYAVMGEKDLALKFAQRAVMLLPRAKDPMYGLGYEENLAQVQAMFGENSSSVISTLAHLLQIPYQSTIYHETGVTPAILRLDPVWDPLRGDPAFQKLCEEKQH